MYCLQQNWVVFCSNLACQTKQVKVSWYMNHWAKLSFYLNQKVNLSQMNKLSVDNMTSAYHWYERLAMRRDWFCTVGINDWWKPIPKKNWTAKICSVPLGLWEFPEKRWLNDHFSSNFEGFLIVIGSFFWAPTGFPTQIKSVAFFFPLTSLAFPKNLFSLRQDQNWRPLPKVVFTSHHLDPDWPFFLLEL